MKKLFAIVVAFYTTAVFAILEVTVLKKDENAFPIVISPFLIKDNAEQGKAIAHIMRDNLNRSGEFNASSSSYIIDNNIDFDKWQSNKTEAIVIGQLEKVSKKIFKIELQLVDVYSKKVLFKSYDFPLFSNKSMPGTLSRSAMLDSNTLYKKLLIILDFD